MIGDYRVYDTDAHFAINAGAWSTLPEHLKARRPRAVLIDDAEGIGGYRITWTVEGKMIPRPFGVGAQTGTTPRGAKDPETFPGVEELADARVDLSLAAEDLTEPTQRLEMMDEMGIDISVCFPSTIWATFTDDPEFEAGLFRSHNRFIGKVVADGDPDRIRWGGLIPLLDPKEACAAVNEMAELGAASAVIFGTAHDKLLSERSLDPVWRELEATGLPLSIHFGASYPGLSNVCRDMYTGNIIGMSLPAFLGFYAVTAGGILDRHPNLRVGFLEFGGEWILYAVSRMDEYLKHARANGFPYSVNVPEHDIIDYAKSGRIFLGIEADDQYVQQEIDLLGEDQLLYSSDIPHAESRMNAASQILAREDVSETFKRKILWDNSVGFFGK